MRQRQSLCRLHQRARLTAALRQADWSDANFIDYNDNIGNFVRRGPRSSPWRPPSWPTAAIGDIAVLLAGRVLPEMLRVLLTVAVICSIEAGLFQTCRLFLSALR
jgi:hypothetical protein